MKKLSKLWFIIVIFSFITVLPIGQRVVQAEEVFYHVLFSSDQIFMVGEDAQAFIKSVVPKERDISKFSKFNVRLFWTDGHVELTEQTSGILQSRRYHLFIEMELKNDYFPEKAEEKLDFMIEDRNKDLEWVKGDIETDFTRYAKVELKTDLTAYKMVTFDVNGGTPDAPRQVVKMNGTADIPVQPKKDGFTFEGWWTKADGGNKYDFTEPVLGDLKLTARWTAIVPPATTTAPVVITTVTVPPTTPEAITTVTDPPTTPEAITTVTDPPTTTEVITTLTDISTTPDTEASTTPSTSEETVPETTLPEESSTTTSETAVAIVDDKSSTSKWLLIVGIALIVILTALISWLLIVAKKKRRNDPYEPFDPNNPHGSGKPYPPPNQYPLGNQYPPRDQYPPGDQYPPRDQ